MDTNPPSKFDLNQNNSVTVKDVAEKAKVSTATVSRVLSGKGNVSKALEKRVLQAVKELDYRPNQSARRLRKRSSKIIGILVADIQNPFFTSMVVGIEKVLQEAGYLTLLGNANESPIQEQKQIEIFLAEDVSGIIFATSMQEVGFYKQILQQGVPLVAVDRNPADLPIDTVETTNAQSANLAVQHLLQDGFQKIGLISGPEHLTTSIQRRQGYEQALVQAGLEIDPSLIYTSNYRQAGGYQGMQILLEHIQLPGAVLILNNLMALGAMQYLHEQHLRIPEDVAVVGFDDMPWATSLQPPLTVVEQPVYDMGLYAARLMLERIAEPTKPVKHLILENKLVVRRSCGCKQKDGHP